MVSHGFAVFCEYVPYDLLLFLVGSRHLTLIEDGKLLPRRLGIIGPAGLHLMQLHLQCDFLFDHAGTVVIISQKLVDTLKFLGEYLAMWSNA